MVGAASGRRNDDDSRRWRGCLFFSSSVQSPRSLLFSSLSVLSCFSSPTLVLLALAALMVAGWRCCCGGGKETQRWCPGGEEWSLFFSSPLLFWLSLLCLSNKSSSSFSRSLLFRFLSSLHSKSSLLCSALFRFLLSPPSRLSLVSTPLVFIGKRRESPHCLVLSCMAQEGNRVTLPLQGKVAGCLQGMVPLSWQGMVVWVWVLAGFLCKWEEEKVSGKKIFKNPLLPCLCICKGEELHSAVQKAPGSLVFFFFFF